MDRRAFLKDGTLAAVSAVACDRLRCGFGARRLMAMESRAGTPNPDWLAAPFPVRATASSFYADPPGGYAPANVRGWRRLLTLGICDPEGTLLSADWTEKKCSFGNAGSKMQVPKVIWRRELPVQRTSS